MPARPARLPAVRLTLHCLSLHPPTLSLPAAPQVGVKVPLIVRLEGTNVERGKEILASSNVDIITASDLDDAASKAVASIR